METDGGQGQDEEATRSNKHNRMIEAMDKGLLQVHGIALNCKQDGIFCLMCKNANVFNNMISGNNKIAKALYIKEDLGIDCLMYCKHCLNLRHKSNKNDFKQMFQQEIACTVIAAYNTHEWQHAG
jgi:hypothetical protein